MCHKVFGGGCKGLKSNESVLRAKSRREELLGWLLLRIQYLGIRFALNRLSEARDGTDACYMFP